MKHPLRSIKVQGFRSLASVKVDFGPLTVLVGPNGSGKSNVLNVLRLLSETIRFDLVPAVNAFGGFEHVVRADGATKTVSLEVEAVVTEHAHAGATDWYKLDISERSNGALRRTEEFTFKRVSGRGRRITVNGSTVTFGGVGSTGKRLELADEQTTGLSTLPKLGAGQGGEGIDDFARFISMIRVLEPDVGAARQPSRMYGAPLADDASNLADALLRLREADRQAFADVERDLARCLPGMQGILVKKVGGSARSVVVQIREKGVAGPVDLADASFGTVRLLSLLTALHEPDPPPFIALEEVDHGLHPYALDVLVDALRAASERTQLLIATHSPTFVNRLEPSELVICDRDPETGASVIPAVDPERVAAAAEVADLRLGELWFSGAIGGVPV